MTRTFVALAAASTLTLSMALAQTSTSPTAPSPPGMATQDMNKDMDKSDAGKSDKAMASPKKIVDAQKPDEWLATKFRGTDVLGPDGVKVGSIDDILFDRNGNIKALVVGVGGFLGIGAKEVALGFKEFQIVPGKDGSADQLKIAMTKDELTAAAEFKPYEPPRPAATAPAPGGGMGGAARKPMAPQ
jgi:sporulation protein YlmC with PRC-barrel domain